MTRTKIIALVVGLKQALGRHGAAEEGRRDRPEGEERQPERRRLRDAGWVQAVAVYATVAQ